MTSPALVAALRRSREKTVELEGEWKGLKVRFLRPPESEFSKMLVPIDPKNPDPTSHEWSVGIEQVQQYVIGWEGFTEATILGATVGSSDPLDFDRELWSEWVADKVDVIAAVARAILDAVVKHITEREAAGKNSASDSTPQPKAGSESKQS